jgi:hypothetical protein
MISILVLSNEELFHVEVGYVLLEAAKKAVASQK